ncbi:hypothetical protein CUZ56_01975 [Saezia sanguinis]|uniref:Protein LemA n=1 Tax=Saezia sanguinis TaxID=1965230 RepID=A0A433SBX8_9BURK|nr:LemA family protein [Saezia sanguinis]RUS66251.1 hypothetical protein CUZ56_01975 [Saezia sanguinis]
MGIIGWVLLALVVIGVIWGISSYNKLVFARNEINNAFGQIDVQLKRRYDLIPNLVEVARKYVQHERETLEAVIGARNQASQARDAIHGQPSGAGIGQIAALAAADGALGSALGRLMAVVEGYPELKADQNLRELSEELTTTENRIGFARQAYNDVVLDYNNKAQQFPEVIVANLFSFKPMEMLQSTESPEERQAVKVQF